MKNQTISKISTILCVAAALATSASAQTGTLDQESPVGRMEFNIDLPSYTWQQQVSVGMAGQLEGIAVNLSGEVGVSGATFSIGLGDAWSTNIVFETVVRLQEDDAWHFIDTTGANIQLQPGDVFVIQSNGNGSGMWINGSYVAPPGDPLYAEPLFLDGDLFGDDGWRHGFRSYMLTGPADCLEMTVSKFTAGQAATWDVSGATPGEQVAIVYGLNAGTTNVNGFAGYCATFGIKGINQNKVICTKTADGNGDIACKKTIPGGMVGVNILSQAAERNTCPDECVSNLDDQVIG